MMVGMASGSWDVDEAGDLFWHGTYVRNEWVGRGDPEDGGLSDEAHAALVAAVRAVEILRKIVNDPMGYVEPGLGVFDCRVEDLTPCGDRVPRCNPGRLTPFPRPRYRLTCTILV